MDLKRLSLAGTALLVVAAISIWVRHALIAVGPVAIAVQIVAVLLMIWARLTFGLRSFHASANPTEGGLVTTGPYRYLRHPIYAAILYFFWAAIASHWGVINALLGVVATVGAAIRIFAEERLVVARYPEYAAYAARTKRIIPFLV